MSRKFAITPSRYFAISAMKEAHNKRRQEMEQVFQAADTSENCVGCKMPVSFHGSLKVARPALLSLQDVVTGAVLLLLVAIVATPFWWGTPSVVDPQHF
jgi:hypothetical protein